MTYILSVILSFLIVPILLYFYVTRNFDYWKKRNVPFSKPIPFAGNLLRCFTMQKNLTEVFTELYNSGTGPYLGFFAVDRPCILLRDPKLVKTILNSDFKYFCDRNGSNSKEADPVGAYILFMLKNPEWKGVRGKMSPVFSSGKMKLMYHLINESGAGLVNYLKSANSDVIDVKSAFSRYTVDVITSTIFGIYSDCYKEKTSEIFHCAQVIFDWNNWWSSFQMRCAFIAPRLAELLRFHLLNPKSTIFLSKLFHSALQQRTKNNIHRDDFIDILMKLKNTESDFWYDNILAAQSIMFFAAGYETSSTAMIYAAYELCKNPLVYAKLKKEIDAIHHRDACFTYDNIKEMTYLEKCVKETIRKYPPLPFLDRICTQDYQMPNSDLVFTKGISVFIPVYAYQNDPKYFPDPERFDPERSSDSLFLGFGTGPRNCIGERFGMLTVMNGLAHIIHEFDIAACQETPDVIIFNKNGVLLSPLHEMKLRMSVRSK